MAMVNQTRFETMESQYIGHVFVFRHAILEGTHLQESDTLSNDLVMYIAHSQTPKMINCWSYLRL